LSTWILTPNTPNQLTGIASSVLGWQLTLATALDALTGCNLVYSIGWVPKLSILTNSAPNAPIWQLVFTNGVPPNVVQIVVNDTDWFVTDGLNLWKIPQATVTANYVVTQKV